MSTLTRWLAPVAASVAVVALIVGITRAMTPSSGGGGPDEPDTEIVGPLLTPSASEPQRGGLTGRGSIRVTGYRVKVADVLVVYYEVDLTDCDGRIARPEVRETRDHVRLTIRRASADVRGQDCGEVTRNDAVEVPLSRPLAGRLVQDARRDNALVPLRMPTLNSL